MIARLSDKERLRGAIEGDIVETIVPLGGFGKTLDAMLEFRTRNGIRAINSTGRRDSIATGNVVAGGELDQCRRFPLPPNTGGAHTRGCHSP